MRSRKTYDKTCEVCGSHFISHSALAIYCPSCKIKVVREQVKASVRRAKAREAVKQEIENEKKAKHALRDIVAEADRNSMSYGYYVALREGGRNDIH